MSIPKRLALALLILSLMTLAFGCQDNGDAGPSASAPDTPNTSDPQATATADPHEELSTISCLLYTSPSPRDGLLSRMPSSA